MPDPIVREKSDRDFVVETLDQLIWDLARRGHLPNGTCPMCRVAGKLDTIRAEVWKGRIQ